jgi:fucose permease
MPAASASFAGLGGATGSLGQATSTLASTGAALASKAPGIGHAALLQQLCEREITATQPMRLSNIARTPLFAALAAVLLVAIALYWYNPPLTRAEKTDELESTNQDTWKVAAVLMIVFAFVYCGPSVLTWMRQEGVL